MRHRPFFITLGLILSILSCAPQARAQDGADNWRTYNVHQVYQQLLGRPAKPKEVTDWRNALGWTEDLSTTEDWKGIEKIRESLFTLMSKPEGEGEVRAMISRSYLRAYGRDAEPGDFNYWIPRVKTERVSYLMLMNAHRAYLRNPANKFMRRNTIILAYFFALGRDPEEGDVTYWLEQMNQKGSNYTDIVKAAIEWVRGDSEKQSKELAQMVRRAFQANGKQNASNEDVNYILVRLNPKQLYNFKEMVEFVKKNGGKKTVKID